MSESLRLAAVHFTPALGARDENRAALLEFAAEAARGADLVVLPELATTGFCLAPDQADALAEPADGPTARALAALARAAQVVLACGLCLREPDGTLRNAQLLFDADGELASVYAKHHLWGSDLAWALAGRRPGAVARTRLGPLAQLICADLGHPRTVAGLARERPRALCFSTAWVGEGEPLPLSWQVALRLLDPAPLVIANRGGAEEWAGEEVLFDDPSAVLAYRAGGALGAREEGPYVVRWSYDA
ncbi:MAG: carbon-nitrogen hydrolase family protein [Planctomycetota bacterium]